MGRMMHITAEPLHFGCEKIIPEMRVNQSVQLVRWACMPVHKLCGIGVTAAKNLPQNRVEQ